MRAKKKRHVLDEDRCMKYEIKKNLKEILLHTWL